MVSRDRVELVRHAVREYVEGWYEADADRVRSVLHPELCHRILRSERGSTQLEQRSAMTVVLKTGGGVGQRAKEAQHIEIRVLDVDGHIASAIAVAAMWVEHLHLAFADERWQIINILREVRATH